MTHNVIFLAIVGLIHLQLGYYFGPGDCSGKARTSLNDRTKSCAFHVVDEEARNERKRSRNTRVWAFEVLEGETKRS